MRETAVAALVAAITTLVFYIPALVANSRNAGIIYTADFWNVWLPMLAQVNSVIQRGAFSGIEFATHGGASEFFIRPGLYPYHPLVLLYSLVSHSGALERLMRFSVLLLAIHSFLGCYFCMRLGQRYLKLGTGVAAFLAVGYAFSEQMVHASAFPPFVLSASLLPWAIYAALVASERPSLRRVLFSSVPVFLILMGGYSVMAFAAAATAGGFVLVYFLFVEADSDSLRARLKKLAWASAPYVVAGVVAFPLYWAMLEYFPLGNGPSAVSLYHSARELAEQPRTILRLLSTHLHVAGPAFEFFVVWGTVPLITSIIFFAGLRDHKELSESEWRLLKVCASVYALIVLAMFGDFSVVSDLFYMIPGIGRMHIYQRHLLLGHFFLLVPIALMLRAVAGRGACLSKKLALFAVAALLVVCAHAVAEGNAVAKDWHLNDYVVMDVLWGLLFTASLMVPGKWFAASVATFLVFLGPLDHTYDFCSYGGLREVSTIERPKHIASDPVNNSRVLAYFRTQSKKAIVKYLDLQPGIDNYFSRNYPWFVAMDLPLSSYGGHEFFQAPRATYSRRMPITAVEGPIYMMLPDWKWVKETGAEFVVYQDAFRLNDPHLAEVADLRDPARVLRLPNNVVIAPLRSLPFLSGFSGPAKGRYVRIQLAGTNYLSLAEVRVLGSVGSATVNLAQGKPSTQSSTWGLGRPSNAVDGNTNGDYSLGSVTHTGLDRNAWWQVDLGASAAINSIEIWNRTDGPGGRLSDYWVFVSDEPFGPSDLPATLQGRPGTVCALQTAPPSPVAIVRRISEAEGGPNPTLFDNGYLRVVGPTAGAAVKGFHTDGGTELTLDLDAVRPVKLQYLFWPNERLQFYVQGNRVDASVDDGLMTVKVPAGRQRVEIRYVYWPARLFLALYLSYAVLLAAAVVIAVIARLRLGLARVAV